MKAILPTSYTIDHAGITFAFRQLPTAESLLLEELLFEPLRELVKAEQRPPLAQMARLYAVLVAMSWDQGGPHGALELERPALATWTDDTLRVFGDAALAELSTGGLLFEDIQTLGMAIRPRLLGRPPLGEAADVADFSDARRGAAPSSPPTSG